MISIVYFTIAFAVFAFLLIILKTLESLFWFSYRLQVNKHKRRVKRKTYHAA